MAVTITSSPTPNSKAGFEKRHIFVISQTDTQVGNVFRRFGYQLLYDNDLPMTKPESTQTTDTLPIRLDFTEVLRSKIRTDLKSLVFNNTDLIGVDTPEMEIKYKFKYWEIVQDSANCTVTVTSATVISDIFLINTTDNVDRLIIPNVFNIYPSVFYEWDPAFIIPYLTSANIRYQSSSINVLFNPTNLERKYIQIQPLEEGLISNTAINHSIEFGCGDFEYFLFQSIKGGISAFSAEIVERSNNLNSTPLFKYVDRFYDNTPLTPVIAASGNTIQLNSVQETITIRKTVQIHDENDMRYYEDFLLSPRVYWIPDIKGKDNDLPDLLPVSLIPIGSQPYFIKDNLLTIQRQFAISRDKTLPNY